MNSKPRSPLFSSGFAVFGLFGVGAEWLSRRVGKRNGQVSPDSQPQQQVGEWVDASEERLRLALDAGRMGTWEWDIVAGKVNWSPMLEKIHGLAVGSFAGTLEAYQQDIHPEDRQRVLATIRQSVEQGQPHHLEYRIVLPDSSVRWLEARGKLFRDAAGQPVRLIGVCSDVTERKALEQQLQQRVGELTDAESRIRSVVDHVIDGIITMDEHGTVGSFNPAAERIFGFAAADVIGQNVRMLLPAPDHTRNDHASHAPPAASEHRNLAALMMERGRDVIGKRKDGSTFPLDLAVSEFPHEGRQFFTAIVRDVTQRKHLEQSLRFVAEASKSLSSLVDYRSTLQMVANLAVPGFADWCAVDMINEQGVLERLAVAHVDPSKITLAEELYQRFPSQPDAPHGVMRVLRTGQSELIGRIEDSMLVASAQDEIHLQILRELDLKSYICVPLAAKEKTLGVITFVSTVPSRAYGADDLEMAEELARRAAIAIENARLYQKVREADRRKDEFLAMLAHELRNPLAPLRSGLELLALDAANDKQTIELMQEQVEHVVRLVDDLLDVSRIMRGNVELRQEPLQLANVVTRSVAAAKPQIEMQQQELTVSLPEQAVWLQADPVRLVQVLGNLLHNASKYTNAGGQIHLAAESRDGQVEIRLQDTGIGIEPELLPNVFELFTQSSRSLDRAQGGMGIGLTLVKRLVEMHGGTVSVHSDGPGQGSTFSVRLPTIAPPQQVDAPPQAASLPEHLQIVVVDDNVSAAWILSKLLGKLGDHHVLTAHDGPSALSMIRESHPDIVLLDIGLPGMDGYEVARAVRKIPELDDVLLVALTGYGQEEDRRHSQQAGFDEHLTKPPSIDQIKAVLDHPRLRRPAP